MNIKYATVPVSTTTENGIIRTALTIPQTSPTQSSPLQAFSPSGEASIDILLPDGEALLRLNLFFRDKVWVDIDVVWKRPNAEVKVKAWKEGEPVIDILIPKGVSLVAVDMNWKGDQ